MPMNPHRSWLPRPSPAQPTHMRDWTHRGVEPPPPVHGEVPPREEPLDGHDAHLHGRDFQDTWEESGEGTLRPQSTGLSAHGPVRGGITHPRGGRERLPAEARKVEHQRNASPRRRRVRNGAGRVTKPAFPHMTLCRRYPGFAGRELTGASQQPCQPVSCNCRDSVTCPRPHTGAELEFKPALQAPVRALQQHRLF